MSNRDSRVEIRAQESRIRAEERVDQRVQTVEGARAMLYTGQSRPVHDQASGFEVIPRLVGDTVQVDIAHQLGASRASGRLGEWFELGSVAIAGSRSETRRVWIRVDELP